MLPDQKNPAKETRLPSADTGNASNPSPHNNDMEPAGQQLIDKKGEKYLRESGNIEDMPDPQDEQDMNEALDDKHSDQ